MVLLRSVRICRSNSTPLVAPGAYVVAMDYANNNTATLATPYTIGPIHEFGQTFLIDLPVSQKYTVTTTVGSDTMTVLSGPNTGILKPGDMLWSDAFLFGSSVMTVTNSIVGTPTVNAGGSGYVGTSGTMTWNDASTDNSCVSGGAYPVLNVTASGGVITGVTSVANAGNCLTATPSSSATTWVAGGGLSGGSGASFNMAFKQTVRVFDVTLVPAPAVVTHSSGSPGQLWTIPVGIKRRQPGMTHEANVNWFGIGLDLICQSGSSPPTGCSGGVDARDFLIQTLIGRLARGNNTGVSSSTNNIYAQNSIADIVEAGTLGSSYFSEENNSAEDQTSLYDTLVFCDSQNYSVFYGSYLSNQPAEDCLGRDAQGNPAIGVAATRGNPGSPLYGVNIQLSPAVYKYRAVGRDMDNGGVWRSYDACVCCCSVWECGYVPDL